LFYLYSIQTKTEMSLARFNLFLCKNNKSQKNIHRVCLFINHLISNIKYSIVLFFLLIFSSKTYIEESLRMSQCILFSFLSYFMWITRENIYISSFIFFIISKPSAIISLIFFSDNDHFLLRKTLAIFWFSIYIFILQC